MWWNLQLQAMRLLLFAATAAWLPGALPASEETAVPPRIRSRLQLRRRRVVGLTLSSGSSPTCDHRPLEKAERLCKALEQRVALGSLLYRSGSQRCRAANLPPVSGPVSEDLVALCKACLVSVRGPRISGRATSKRPDCCRQQLVSTRFRA